MNVLTLTETASSLHSALRDYIEATYHISDEPLVVRRRRLLDQPEVIRQNAYIESTPRYKPGDHFEKLGLPAAAQEILLAAATTEVNGNWLLHNPPYEHQAHSLRATLVDGDSLMVTTGTGSGKTECFLLPILGHLAEQANGNPKAFATPALRAIVLYPMNALVNDQLGRLRLLFGHEVIASRFMAWSGRPARFARYTSRTLYPGVRTSNRDTVRLKPLGTYYAATEERAAGDPSDPDVAAASRLMQELRRRGKWPAKLDMVRWFGASGTRWRNRDGEFVRAVTLPEDPELLTRHEVLAAPPDILVTNYSMLEYMLMRPLERPVFDATRRWLSDHAHERFILVVDEAHLYRGAAGTEVALLLRRLRDRLGLEQERLQVICTSASFDDPDRALEFGAKLTGKEPSEFKTVRGELARRSAAGSGSVAEGSVLASVDVDAFYGSPSDEDRLRLLGPLWTLRNIKPTDVRTGLFAALHDFGPMGLLVNETMERALRVDELGSLLFPALDKTAAQRAATTLVALGSYAREEGNLDGPGLLPSRIHAFFRALPGLWVCIDPACSLLPAEERGGPVGSLFGQPHSSCPCGARVFELLTCQQCGSAYARAYTDSLSSPQFLWPESGERIAAPTEDLSGLFAIDILLDAPADGAPVRPADLDMETARVNPAVLTDRVRQVFLPPDSSASLDEGDEIATGTFVPCAVCGKSRSFGRTYVQDHQTKGDEPFRALITRQVEVQQPTATPTDFAPLGGRKVLVFSDSRQTAARLAPNLQRYSTQDAVRPLLLYGFDLLGKEAAIRRRLSLADAYLAVLLAASKLGVRLRPVTRVGENFEADQERAARSVSAGELADAEKQLDLLLDFRERTPPEYLLRVIREVINHTYTGLNALGLASIREVETLADVLDRLPDLVGITNPDEKRSLLRTWLDSWKHQWLSKMPHAWIGTEVHPESGKFPTRLKYILGSARAQKAFTDHWGPILLDTFTQAVNSKFLLKGGSVTLAIGGDWAYCRACRSTLRPWHTRVPCPYCGRDAVELIDPDKDPVFTARKGYYRRDAVEALRGGRGPVAIIAAEHTAQLNDAQADEVFSDAEEHELLFQDVDLGERRPAIDVLSCTTTMEVGIDIGALSGVALRNMPPSRANYQQRAGRAGRRSRAVATVTAFAGADSHDEHCFREPDQVIRGRVIDPELGLDNWQIARRHLTAFVIQEYLQARLPSQPATDGDESADARSWQLFEVLGRAADFLRSDSKLNLQDFTFWVEESLESLAGRAEAWLPIQLDIQSDLDALQEAIGETPGLLSEALQVTAKGDIAERDSAEGDPAKNATEEIEASRVELDGQQLEVPAEPGDQSPTEDPSGQMLLDVLLYRGVLPRYAFPTDVASFYVFSPDSTRQRPTFRYSPSQGLGTALSQYAPGKRVWIGGKEWRSGAIYSPRESETFGAWRSRRWYMECQTCGYAKTVSSTEAERREQQDCPACGDQDQLGPAMAWFRPPGFAHPVTWDEEVSPDDEPVVSHASRAKLTAPTPADPLRWRSLNERVSSYFDQLELLVSNTGPKRQGYDYCTRCGLIEPASSGGSVVVTGHMKPYPDGRKPQCGGEATARGVVLGTRFISDVLLVSLKVQQPLTLRPDYTSTRTALRTLSEALRSSACDLLGIDPSELQAEFRMALTPGGRSGAEAEIYLYDTLAGGAGFAQRAGQLGLKLFDRALSLLRDCPANCETSCYRCLRSYRNKFDHSDLDRHIGASLLEYLLTGDSPTLDPERAKSSLSLLFQDLTRLGIANVNFERDAEVEVSGVGRLSAPILATLAGERQVVLVLQVPFTSSVLVPAVWTDAAEYSLNPQVLGVDELALRRGLPRASSELIGRLGLS